MSHSHINEASKSSSDAGKRIGVAIPLGVGQGSLSASVVPRLELGGAAGEQKRGQRRAFFNRRDAVATSELDSFVATEMISKLLREIFLL